MFYFLFFCKSCVVNFVKEGPQMDQSYQAGKHNRLNIQLCTGKHEQVKKHAVDLSASTSENA
jgi:hypothetical protein